MAECFSCSHRCNLQSSNDIFHETSCKFYRNYQSKLSAGASEVDSIQPNIQGNSIDSRKDFDGIDVVVQSGQSKSEIPVFMASEIVQELVKIGISEQFIQKTILQIKYSKLQFV